MARLKKRANGYFQASFTYEGKRHTVYARTTAELAEKKALKFAELKAGTADRANPRLEDYMESFLERRHDKVSPATIRIQRTHFGRVSNLPIDQNGKTFGQMRIADITPANMLTIQEALSEKYSARTTNDTTAFISFVFEAAIREEVIDKNPCRVLESVKQKGKKASETVHRALSHEEARRFFEAAEGSFYKSALMFLLQTGLRIGELAALNDFSVDEKNRMLHVTCTQTRTENGAYIVGENAKTAAGVRDVPLTEEALKTIKEQKALKSIVFGNTQPVFLFPSSCGGMITSMIINTHISKICKAAGIERFTAHGLRATFATYFLEQRAQDYKALSEILGHSTTDITLNLYAHLLQERKISAMNAVHIAI